MIRTGCVVSVLATLGLLGAGCGGGGGGSPDGSVVPPVDASSADAGVVPDGGNSPDGAVTCATAAMGLALGLFPSGGATSGATVGYVGCGATTTATGTPAMWNLMVSQQASYFRLTHTGFRTSLSAEINPVVFSAGATLPLQLVSTGLTPYDAGKAHLLVSIGTAVTPCTKAGNTVSLPGHPEAVVSYINAAGASTGGTSTSNDGLAWLTGIVPGLNPIGTPTLTSGVSGCTPRTTFSTGNVNLVVDAVTVLNAEMRQ